MREGNSLTGAGFIEAVRLRARFEGVVVIIPVHRMEGQSLYSGQKLMYIRLQNVV